MKRDVILRTMEMEEVVFGWPIRFGALSSALEELSSDLIWSCAMTSKRLNVLTLISELRGAN